LLTTKNKNTMKKTTLLIIGALAFVLQATAQTTIYSEDFESQTLGATPQDWNGNNLSTWSGGSSTASSTFDVESILDSTGDFNTQVAVLGVTMGPPVAGGWFGWQIQHNGATLLPGPLNGVLSDFSFSADVESVSGGMIPTVWLLQYNASGGQIYAASYTPVMNPDGQWTHIGINMDNFTPQGGQPSGGVINPALPFYFDFDGGGGNTTTEGVVNEVAVDNLYIVADNSPIPEPGTIALLTLGGLGALVGLRRRS
jgi:hypothetical protein